MARITDEDIEKVREATDIVSLIGERIVLKQKSGVFWGCCPFHGEKTPSFKVDPTSGLFYCFGCHEHGDAFKFLQLTESLEFPEAVRVLAERAHIELEATEGQNNVAGFVSQVRSVCEDTATFYHDMLNGLRSPEADAARSYLGSRGFGSEISKTWQLGFAPGNGSLVAHLKKKGHSDKAIESANVGIRSGLQLRDRFYNRVMFPIRDVSGRVIAFGGRVIGQGNPKYLNSSDTPIFHKSRNMYGIDKAKPEILKSKTAVVVEGYTDVIALSKSGIVNAVATLGTALTSEHIKLLSRFAIRIIYIFDGDEAGLRAADRAVEFIDQTITVESSANPIVLDVVVLPAGTDPADIASSEGGAQEFSKLLKTAVPLIRFAIDRRLSRWDLSRPEERQRAINDCTSILVPIKGSVMATDYAQYIVDKLWASGVRVELSQILDALANQKNTMPNHSVPDEQGVVIKSGTNLFVLGKEATSDERLAQEIIAFMVLDKRARNFLAQNVETDMFVSQIYRQMFSLLSGELKQSDIGAAVSRLTDAFPGSDAFISTFNFTQMDETKMKSLVEEMVLRMKETSMEREVAHNTAKLKDETSRPDERVELIRTIAKTQLELSFLRTKRHLS
ncbi:MAG: DNA primase [Coriobacteriia bacterium]|nr:DNA primase [Coriobacteriia bacterium]